MKNKPDNIRNLIGMCKEHFVCIIHPYFINGRCTHIKIPAPIRPAYEKLIEKPGMKDDDLAKECLRRCAGTVCRTARLIYHAEDVGVKEWHDAVHLWLDYVPRSEVFPEFTFEAIMTSCVPDVRLTLKLRTTELTPECTSLAYAKTFLALGVLASNIEPKKRRFSLIDTTMLTLRCPASNVTAGMYKKEHPSEPYGSDWSKQAKLDDIVDSLKPVALKLLD